MSRFSGGGNWYGVKNRYAHRKEFAAVKKVPTQQQKKYYQFLLKKCEESGVEPAPVDCESRDEYKWKINKMCKRLIEAGVDIHWEGKPKYRFDKFGNTIEIATGKIVKKG